MEFKTLFNYHGRVKCPQCSKVRQERIYNQATKKIENGELDNFYERIQSHYESTNIARKIERYQFGDITALGVPGGSYGDYSNVNTDLAQILQAGTSASEEFNNLSPAIKELFGNDVGKFLAALRDGSYEKTIRDYAAAEVARLSSIGTAGEPGSQGQGGN